MANNRNDLSIVPLKIPASCRGYETLFTGGIGKSYFPQEETRFCSGGGGIVQKKKVQNKTGGAGRFKMCKLVTNIEIMKSENESENESESENENKSEEIENESKNE
jgi:hypothetical protein